MGEVGSHDVPEPVAGIGAGDTGHVERVGQEEMLRQLPTQSTHLVHPSTEIIQLARGDNVVRNVAEGTFGKGGVHTGSQQYHLLLLKSLSTEREDNLSTNYLITWSIIKIC